MPTKKTTKPEAKSDLRVANRCVFIVIILELLKKIKRKIKQTL
jgi:hypothetical protein